jgi:DNA-binding GntR family transcriptional regulator
MEVVRQHEAMIKAVASRDVDEADALARAHTDLFRDRIERYLKNNLAGNVPLESRA